MAGILVKSDYPEKGTEYRTVDSEEETENIILMWRPEKRKKKKTGEQFSLDMSSARL